MKIQKTLIINLAILIASIGIPAWAVDESPSQAYLRIFQQELASTSYEDCLKFRSKASIASDPKMSPEETKQTFELFKMIMPKEVNVVSEEVNGKEATVHATAPAGIIDDPKSKTTGVIKLVMEGGQWKLVNEKWETKLPEGDSQSSTPSVNDSPVAKDAPKDNSTETK